MADVAELLANYLRSALSRGYTLAQLRPYILKKGYRPSDFDAAAQRVLRKASPMKQISHFVSPSMQKPMTPVGRVQPAQPVRPSVQQPQAAVPQQKPIAFNAQPAFGRSLPPSMFIQPKPVSSAISISPPLQKPVESVRSVKKPIYFFGGALSRIELIYSILGGVIVGASALLLFYFLFLRT